MEDLEGSEAAPLLAWRSFPLESMEDLEGSEAAPLLAPAGAACLSLESM